MTRTKKLAILGVAMAILAGLAVWRGPELHAWWSVHQLAHADATSFEACVRHVASLDERAVPALLDGWSAGEEAPCRNLEAGARALVQNWLLDEPRTLRLLERVRNGFPGFSTEGKRASLRLAAYLGDRPTDPVGTMPSAVSSLLGELFTATAQDSTLALARLGLAGPLATRDATGQWRTTCRDLACQMLGEREAPLRVAALQVLLREPLRQDRGMQNLIVPLLRDVDPAVRRHALLALAPEREIASEELLLPLLHDDDPDIQRLCEVALRSRGLSEVQVSLARLIGSPDPAIRLEVLPHLEKASDLDPAAWLHRLTMDAAPAVRAAAVRQASRTGVPLHDRLQEMSRTDPSPTVREIASHYLQRSTLQRTGMSD